jgi:hypothetical protein
MTRGRYIYPFFEPPDRPARPHLPLRIVNPTTRQRLTWDCLIDTGADACLFPRAVAGLTGHNLKGEGVRGSITGGIEGHPVRVWQHSFVLELLDPICSDRVVWESAVTQIACLEHDECPPLLGVEDFLRHFKVTLDYAQGLTTIQWAQGVRHRQNSRNP